MNQGYCRCNVYFFRVNSFLSKEGISPPDTEQVLASALSQKSKKQ